MLRALAALALLALAAPAAALGYVPGDPNVPVFSALGPNPPSAETPTNFGMVQAAPIALPARQTGPAAMNQSITGSVSGNILTLDSAPSGGDLPISTQIINSTIGGCATSANCPVVTAETDSTHYTLSQTNASPTSLHIAITTQPLGAFEDAIVGWDSQLYQNFDSGFASSCLSAHAIGVPSLGDISHVDFHLNGGTSGGSLITATATTINSDTGMPEFCWAAPVSLFAGHNGTQQVDAVVWPVVGWPVVMQSAQPVSMTASSSTATIPALTTSNNTIAGTATKLFFVTNSSDPATFPNAAMSSTAVGGGVSFLGIYCVISGSGPDTFQIEEASYVGKPNNKPLVNACNIQVTGTADGTNPTVTITGTPSLQPGGTPVVGQKISGSGLSNATITGVAGNVLTVSAVPTATAGATFTLSGAIPATASGATFTMTPFHAGGSFEPTRSQNMGSYFFTVNPPGTANSIPEIIGYAANTGSNSNAATQSSPAQTLTGALKAVTPANAYSLPSTSLTTTTTQSIGSAVVSGANCTTFTKTGNSSYPLRYTVKFDGIGADGGVFVFDGIYFVKDNGNNGLATNTMTLSAVSGGPCINDTLVTSPGATCVPASINCVNLWADYSFTTLEMQCVPSGPITCDDGHPALFALGDGGAINRFARLGALTVTRDPANSTFDNVVVNSEGSQGTNGSNFNSVGLGVESVHMLSTKNVIPTLTVHLLQPLPAGRPITSIVVASSEIPTGFPIITPSGSNGSETTQVIDGGNCIPSVGPGGFGAITTVTVPSTPTTVGSTTIISLVASPATRVFNAFNTCPIGTAITLQNNWSYIGGVNFWFDQSLMQSPYALTIGPSGASQIARGWTGSQTATGSTTVKLGQPYNGMDRVANSKSIKAVSKGITNAWMITGSLIDQGGDLAIGNYNQVGNFFGYGLSAPEVDDFSTINGTVSSSTLTVNSVSSGAVSPYMLLTYTGQTAANGLFIDSQIDATHFSLNGGGASFTGTITLHRSIWKIGPPLNTTPGNTSPLPEMNTGYDAYWFCTGFATSGIGTASPYFDRVTSTVILAGGPGSSSGPNCLLDGNSYLTIHTGIHEDMETVGGGSTGAYLTGLIIDGLTTQNSQGFGYAYLQPAPTVAQNMFVGNSNVQLFLDLAGQQSYAAAAMSNLNRNLLFRNDAWSGTNNALGGAGVSVTNGAYVWDGVNCGGNPAFWTNLGATIPGIVIRNTNWPNMPVGAPAGTC